MCTDSGLFILSLYASALTFFCPLSGLIIFFCVDAHGWKCVSLWQQSSKFNTQTSLMGLFCACLCRRIANYYSTTSNLLTRSPGRNVFVLQPLRYFSDMTFYIDRCCKYLCYIKNKSAISFSRLGNEQFFYSWGGAIYAFYK